MLKINKNNISNVKNEIGERVDSRSERFIKNNLNYNL